MSLVRLRQVDALCVFVAAWLPLNPALSGLAVWITSHRAAAASADPGEASFVASWTGSAAAIAGFMAVASVGLGLLLVAAVHGRPIGGALRTPLTWCAVLFGWFMTRNNPISVDWGGDPDGLSAVWPFLPGWLGPVLAGHLACLSVAAVAVTALNLRRLLPVRE
jgi:hypothetical protein